MINKLRNYELIHELLNQGKAGICPEIEPIEIEAIVSALESRSRKSFGEDALRWIDWFLNEETAGTKNERDNMAIVKKIRDIERKALKRLGVTDIHDI